jgi:cytochrome c-type biogenesis protein CcmH/NrfF
MRGFSQNRWSLAGLVVLTALLAMGAGDDARFNNLGHKLMCVCGCNQVLLECNHVGCAYSDRMRGELAAGVERSESDDLTLQTFVQKYGPTVLIAPTSTGFNRVAWLVPYLALALGVISLVVLARNWSHRTQPVSNSASQTPDTLDAYRRQARKETEL